MHATTSEILWYASLAVALLAIAAVSTGWPPAM